MENPSFPKENDLQTGVSKPIRINYNQLSLKVQLSGDNCPNPISVIPDLLL
jgi:hypothetical protein